MANGRARALGDTTGMVKFLADAVSDEILGVHIVDPMASELIAEAVVAMEFRASSEDIAAFAMPIRPFERSHQRKPPWLWINARSISEMSTSVIAAYEKALQERGFVSDPAQVNAIRALEGVHWNGLHTKKEAIQLPQKAVRQTRNSAWRVHVWRVGSRQKLFDGLLFHAVPIQRKTRLHFHEFMREVHRELRDLQGIMNPLDELGKRMAQRYKLICLTSFMWPMTDAMVLHRLLDALFKHGVGFVTTSNFHPDGLYPDGLHRDRILPAIELLKQRLEVINVDHGTDRRRIATCGSVPHRWMMPQIRQWKGIH